MHFETPATPQTRAFLDPFSVLHKWRLHMGTAKVKNSLNPKVKPNSNGNLNVTTTATHILRDQLLTD
ncbi:hypothetical protein ACO0LL_10150 [Undibacterium sp. TC4M20W]|uniref:hypothetical protein n=1 Tax=Undibacterium sp. TC4M20W TaxID=3413052 RepID=UPI003BEFD90D